MIILANADERRRIETFHKRYEVCNDQRELNERGVYIRPASYGMDCAMHTRVTLGIPAQVDLMEVILGSNSEIASFREFQPGENYIVRYYNAGEDEPHFQNTAVHLGGNLNFWRGEVPLVESKWSLANISTHPICAIPSGCGGQYRIFHFGDKAQSVIQTQLRDYS